MMLHPRQQEVLELLATGKTNREIAAELFLSIDTVKTYLQRLYTVLDVKGRAEAVAVGYQQGLLEVRRE